MYMYPYFGNLVYATVTSTSTLKSIRDFIYRPIAVYAVHSILLVSLDITPGILYC